MLLAVAVTIFVGGTGVFDGMDVGDCLGWLTFEGVKVDDGRIVTTGVAYAVKVGRNVEV